MAKTILQALDGIDCPEEYNLIERYYKERNTPFGKYIDHIVSEKEKLIIHTDRVASFCKMYGYTVEHRPTELYPSRFILKKNKYYPMMLLDWHAGGLYVVIFASSRKANFALLRMRITISKYLVELLILAVLASLYIFSGLSLFILIWLTLGILSVYYIVSILKTEMSNVR